jgi:predicted MFS family arabinose efflux permease
MIAASVLKRCELRTPLFSMRDMPALLLLRMARAVVRAVGVGEGVVLPSMNALVATSVLPARKSSALGSIFSCFHCGNLVGLATSPLIIASYGWAALFVTFGALGAPLLLLWHTVMPTPADEGRVRDDAPAKVYTASKTEPLPARLDAAMTRPVSPGASDSSLAPQSTSASTSHEHLEDLAAESAKATSVRALLSHRATLAIVVANFVNHWGYFIFLSWIPAYFATVYGLDLKASALMAFMPWIAMAAGSSMAGVLADALIKHFHVRPACSGALVSPCVFCSNAPRLVAACCTAGS